MAFREKSAWVMAAVTGLAGLYYLNLIVAIARDLGEVPPAAGAFVPFVILIIAASIAAQVALAILEPREADRPADERERPILAVAGNWSGLVLGIGAVTALLHFLYYKDGDLLFHMVMGSLILSQFSEYLFQILLFRRGV